MDTLSHDSSSSSPITTYLAIGAGVLGVILSGTALFKLATVKKEVEALATEMPAKISTLEGDVRTAATKNENDNRALREGVQNALNQLGDQIGALRGQVTKLEEAQKARPAAAAGKGAAAATGVLNPDGTYSIAPGDTLAKIARKFAVKVDAIEAENPGLDPARLKVGQKIHVPKK